MFSRFLLVDNSIMGAGISPSDGARPIWVQLENFSASLHITRSANEVHQGPQPQDTPHDTKALDCQSFATAGGRM